MFYAYDDAFLYVSLHIFGLNDEYNLIFRSVAY